MESNVIYTAKQAKLLVKCPISLFFQCCIIERLAKHPLAVDASDVIYSKFEKRETKKTGKENSSSGKP